MSKIQFLNIFKGKCALDQKVHPLPLSTEISFVLLNAKYPTQIVLRPKFKGHPHIAKAFSSAEHIYKHVQHHMKLIFGGSKLINPNHLKQKKAKFVNYWGLKAS